MESHIIHWSDINKLEYSLNRVCVYSRLWSSSSLSLCQDTRTDIVSSSPLFSRMVCPFLALWGNAPWPFTATRKRHFLRTSLPKLFKGTAAERFVFFRGVLGDNRKLYCLSWLPCTVWSQSSSTRCLERPPSPTASTVCFWNRYLLLVVGFCFSDSAQKGNLFSLCLQKYV